MSIHDSSTVLRRGEEVADALAEGRPVVALESSGVTGGPTYPANLDMALAVEEAVRASGAVPARVGLLDGALVVGMTPAELDRMAHPPGVPKAGTRDIGPVLASGGLGAATVSAAMVAAGLAGIEVFSVAGIGGVHRDAQRTFDISTDLVQFTRTRMAVVCAGAKSVLDLALTLEYLETHGVPVIGYRCEDFPAYYSRSSGLANPHRVDDLAEVGAAVRAHWAVGNPGAVLVTHPIAEADALPAEEIEAVLAGALAEADRLGVRGQSVTPHLLSALARGTGGRTTAANRSVLISTVRLAGELAAVLSSRELANGVPAC
ncbi:pseudouridine-5'-phosphate glycosidase [Allokutzneria oryzae]|uniref:Pseudouridine-5'-phosphate glycosidase n=1 Tax=Allokutzneria oryzae TaxID=1378989 RepID=A0ABV6A707_9PSEU